MGWDTSQLDWQPQCPQETQCPNVTWFWLLAAGMGLLLLLKDRKATPR